MGSGLILNGHHVPVPGIDVVNYLDDPRLRLDPGDRRLRTAREISWIHLVVMHTTGGIPGGKDLRSQVVKSGIGQSTGGGQRIVASWSNDKDRPGGAHLVVDQDGRSYCCADLLAEAAYHAERANGCSIGIEVVQGHASPDLYEGQLAAAAALALEVCRLMPVPIQWQIPTAYTGPVPRFTLSLVAAGTPLADVVGLVGHRDLTANRGSGDPGDAMMDALAKMGCERMDFAHRQDLLVWKQRQRDLGIASADGVAGSATAAALKSKGYSSGIWQLGPVKEVAG
jgi:hypothetical protein